MNFRFALLLLLGNFFSFYGMKKEVIVRSVSQDLFDLKTYPATLDQMITFEKAKRNIEKNRYIQAEQQLLSLASNRENPYVPAMRELVHLAAQKNDYNGMALWATRAIDRYNPDPACAVTLAGLLDSDHTIALFNNLNKKAREDIISGLLISAAIPRRFVLAEKPAIEYVYQDQNAQTFLDRVTIKCMQGTHEQELHQLTKPDLERLQFDVITKKSLPTACFFIKELISTYKEWQNDENEFCINRNGNHALQWAIVVAGERSGANYLIETGAYDLLADLGNRTEDDALKQQIETFLERIDSNGSDISLQEQKKAEEYLLQLACSKDLRALLALAKGNDPKLFYASQLVYLLPEACQQEYAQLIKSTLQLLKPIVAEPNNSAICKPGEFFIERNNAAGELLLKLLESPQFELYKDTLLRNSRASEIGSLIYEIGCNFFNKKNSKQVRDVGKSILQAARADGDIYAHWKLLAINKQAQTVDNFIAACSATRRAKTKVDKTLLALISDVLTAIEKEPSPKLRAQLGSVCIAGQAELQGVSMLVHAGQPGLETLLDLAPTMQDARACFEAGRHLIAHAKSLDQEKLTKALAANFKSIITYGDSRLKKELTDLLKPLEETDFFIAMIFKEFCAELGDNASRWQQESAFVNNVIDILLARASKNQKLKIFLKETLQTYAQFIKHPKIPDPAARAQEILHELALDGNVDALFAMIPQFSAIEPTLPALIKAADFWHAFWKATHKAPTLKEKAEINMRHIVHHYADICKKNNVNYIDFVFSYKAMMVLAETEPAQTMKFLYSAEDAISRLHNPVADTLLEITGARAFIDEQVNKQTGWGYFAKAVISLFRKHTRNSISFTPDQKIQELINIHTLLKQAERSHAPFMDNELLNEGMIDYWLGVIYHGINVALMSGPEAQAAGKKCVEYYNSSAEKGCSGAAFQWAQEMLETVQEVKSQEIFERAIDRLIQATNKEHKEAREYLQKIYDHGFAQAWCCGGAMTVALREKIEKVLESSKKPANNKESMVPEARMARAIHFLNTGHCQDAQDLFILESAAGNPIADIYLGIIEKQNLLGTGDNQVALKFFKKALFAWNGSTDFDLNTLSIGYSALLEESNNDLESAHAAVHFILHAYTAQQNAERAATLFKNLDTMESIAAKSSQERDKYLLFTSGISQRLASLYSAYTDISVLFSLIAQYAKRIVNIGIPDEQSQQEHLKELLTPFNNLSSVLVTQIIEGKRCGFFADYSVENTRVLFSNLERAAQKGISGCVPVERILGLLHLSKAIKNTNGDSDAKRGVMWLQKAADHGDKEAALVLGYIKMHGSKWCPNLPNEPKKGIEILDALAQKGFLRANLLLAYWYFDKKDFKFAEKYVKQILDKDKSNATAALIAARIYYEAPALLPTSLDRGIYLYNLGQVAILNDASLLIPGQLFQILLTISKYPHVMPVQEVANILEKLLFSAGHKQLLADEIMALSKKQSFIDLLHKWADKKLENSQNNQALELAYAFLGWWYIVCGNSTFAEQHCERDYKRAQECLETAQRIKNNKSLLAESLLLKLTIEKPAPAAIKLEIGKKHFDKIRELTKEGTYNPEYLSPVQDIVKSFLGKVMEANKKSKK